MSDNPSTIAGVIVDARGNPVEGARVYFVEGPVPLPDIAALTDSDGRFCYLHRSQELTNWELHLRGLRGSFRRHRKATFVGGREVI